MRHVEFLFCSFVGSFIESVNSKLETRNSKQIRNINVQNPKWGGPRSLETFRFRYLDLITAARNFTIWILVLLTAVVGSPGRLTAEEVANGAALAAFREECGKLAKKTIDADQMAVKGKDGWLFLAQELRHVSAGRFWGKRAVSVSTSANPKWADPLPAIVDFNEQLDKLGVKLILLPVPCKAVVYPDKVGDAVKEEKNVPVFDTAHREFYRLLRDKGVQVVDAADTFRAERNGENGPLHCKTDTHWSGWACVRVAQILAKEIKARDWYKGIAKTRFAAETKVTEIAGDLWESLNDKEIPKDQLKLRFVGSREGAILTPFKPDTASPVLLLGDSHALIFHAGDEMKASGAGLADQLAFELSFPIDVLGVRASGATPSRMRLMRRARRDAGYLANKKVVIWCFAAREFTETGGWRKIRLMRKK